MSYNLRERAFEMCENNRMIDSIYYLFDPIGILNPENVFSYPQSTFETLRMFAL